MLQFFKKTNIDFISRRKAAILFSATIIIAGLIVMIINGPKWSIDFQGGLEIQIRFQNDVSDGDIRAALTGIEIGEVKTVTGLGQKEDFLIRTKEEGDFAELQRQISDKLDAAFASNPHEIRGVDVVGPKVGQELRRQAIISAIVAMILLVIYISWRFEFKFAVGGVIALLHDVLVTMAFFAFFGYEFSLSVLAAFLTLIGFSLNDTIVIYDRIRENLKKLRQISLAEIMNQSINETLSRTIITSLTVFLTILVLFIFGGPVLRGFSFAMLVGILTGTYSSVFIAAPVVLEWSERSALKGKKR
ncbi:protein translocase subunit SecF [bacterium]|nr:protein translocase subunit SecF [bacterium]MBU1637679.1 protein translocase subunit SecF [bacterium]MBU1919657.1 protein translocase subunit SecF [bacterium]